MEYSSDEDEGDQGKDVREGFGYSFRELAENRLFLYAYKKAYNKHFAHNI